MRHRVPIFPGLLALCCSWPCTVSLEFFQISDLHLDQAYSTRGSISERCHKEQHADPSTDGEHLGPVGDYACDPPYALFQSALKTMRDLNPSPHFILWTGDSNPHWVDGPDFDYIHPNLRNITKELQNAFPHTPIIPALGNHDTYEPDNYPDGVLNDTGSFYSRYIEEGSWGDLIPPVSWETFKLCGFYARTIPLPDEQLTLKAIVLNTNIYYYNKLPLDPRDPCGQLDWLEKELAQTGETEKVLITGHVPPGFFERDLHPDHPMFSIPNGENLTRRYLDIVSRPKFAPKIIAHFFGHTHTDTFRLVAPPSNTTATSGTTIKDEETDDHPTTKSAEVPPVGLIFICPSITPSLYLDSRSHGINPSFRVYSMNATTAIIDNYDHYYLPLDQVQPDHDIGNISALWQIGYGAQSAFQQSSLSISSMHAVYEGMKANPQGAVFQDYYRHNTVFHFLPEDETCSVKCHVDMICAIANLLPKGLKSCQNGSEIITEPSDAHTEPTMSDVSTILPTMASTKPRAAKPPALEGHGNTFQGQSDNNTMTGVYVGFSVICVLAIILAAFANFRHLQRQRRRQREELLLTDQAFKYDSLSDVEDWS